MAEQWIVTFEKSSGDDWLSLAKVFETNEPMEAAVCFLELYEQYFGVTVPKVEHWRKIVLTNMETGANTVVNVELALWWLSIQEEEMSKRQVAEARRKRRRFIEMAVAEMRHTEAVAAMEPSLN